MSVRAILLVLVVTLVLTLAGCSAKPALDAIEITPPAGSQVLSTIGQTAQFKAVGFYSTGGNHFSTRDITSAVQWSSSVASVATIDSKGLVTAVSSGNAIITASTTGTMGMVTGTSSVFVSTSGGGPHDLLSLSIIPSTQVLNNPGETAQFIAIGTFNSVPFTQDMTNQSTWVSSDIGVATIDSAGLATAGTLADRVGIAAIAERGAGLLHGGKPGRLDELEQSARGRGRRPGRRVEPRLDLCGGQEVIEARASGLRRLLNGAGHRRAGGGIAGIDQHEGLPCPAPTGLRSGG